MYSVEDLAKYISFEKIPTSWINCYEDIKKCYNCSWLDNYDFKEILAYYEFDRNFQERFFKELSLLKQDECLNQICFIMYYILFLADPNNYNNIWSWKSSKLLFQNNGSYMIAVVALLCGHEFHLANIKKRGFDAEQIKLQKANILLTCTNDKNKYGMDGNRFSQMIWGSFFMKGVLIQIGRLQYEVSVENFSKLDKYFAEKHQYIYIHIPRDKDLKEEDVEDSFRLVGPHIKKHYPELEGEKLAYYTQSWLLSPEVKEILPEDSNILQFQKKFKIIEYEENINDFLNFVFEEISPEVNYNELPEKTTLQREIKQRLINGEKLHLGLGFLEVSK